MLVSLVGVGVGVGVSVTSGVGVAVGLAGVSVGVEVGGGLVGVGCTATATGVRVGAEVAGPMAVGIRVAGGGASDARLDPACLTTFHPPSLNPSNSKATTAMIARAR